MDILKEKQNKTYDYTSRYAPFYFAYNTLDNKYVYGLTAQLNQKTEYVTHKVIRTDTLDSLSNKYFGRPDLFWVIADFNHILDATVKLYPRYKTLKIPAIATATYAVD